MIFELGWSWIVFVISWRWSEVRILGDAICPGIIRREKRIVGRRSLNVPVTSSLIISAISMCFWVCFYLNVSCVL